MTGTDEEAAWVERSRNGDPDAFASLIRIHQRMIHSLTYRMTGSMAEADDLAEETFIKAYDQLDSYRGDAKFSSWLYRIAINLCLDWQRRERSRTRAMRAWAQERDCGQPSPSEDLGKRLQSALMRLPAKQRAAITLTVYEGMSHAEVAGVLGCTVAAVSWRVFAARRRLVKILSTEAQP